MTDVLVNSQDAKPQTKDTLHIYEVRQEIDDWLADYFADMIAMADDINAGYGDLWRAMKSTVQNGGKRLRPYFLLLSYYGFGGRDIKSVIPVAASHELLHQCLLMHDDIIDRDYIRHGHPNVSGILQQKYSELGHDAVHYADSAAILAGDLLLSDTFSIINQAGLGATVTEKLLQNVRRAVFHVAAGELIDVECVTRMVDQTDPMDIAYYKTASYSFILPLTSGALLVGASDEAIAQIETLGRHLGVAYQIQDDILGLFGDEKITGKSTLSDLREGKHTFLITETMSRVDKHDQATIQSALGNNSLTPDDVNVVRQIIVNAGVYDDANQLVNLHSEAATKVITELTIDSETKHQLLAVIQKLVGRKS